jgi:hypothetical protein
MLTLVALFSIYNIIHLIGNKQNVSALLFLSRFSKNVHNRVTTSKMPIKRTKLESLEKTHRNINCCSYTSRSYNGLSMTIAETSDSGVSSSTTVVGNNNGLLLGQPYRFDLDLLATADGGTLSPTTLQLPEQQAMIRNKIMLREDEDTILRGQEYESADVTIVINNEEAITSKQIDIGEVNSDLAYSMLSNRCFLLGASADFLSCLWDTMIVPSRTIDSTSMLSASPSVSYSTLYMVLASIAPFIYLFNSFIDVQWAEHRKNIAIPNEASMNKTDTGTVILSSYRRDTISTTSDTYHYYYTKNEPREEVRGQTQQPMMQNLTYTSSNSVTTNIMALDQNQTRITALFTERQILRIRRRIKTFSPKRQLIKVVKRSAHRHETYAAFSFGVAAFFSVVNLLLVSSSVQPSTFSTTATTILFPDTTSDQSIFNTLSVHTYLLSAIFAVTRSRHRPWTFSWMETPDILEGLYKPPFPSFIPPLLYCFNIIDIVSSCTTL